MDENERKPCLEPNIEKRMFRQKTFFEVAAAQSSGKSVNPHLPESLLTPLVTVLDPCTLNSTIHARLDWNRVEARLVKSSVMSRDHPRGRQSSPESGNTSDASVRSGSGSPRHVLTKRGKNGPEMDAESTGNEEDVQIEKENEQFIDEVTELIRDVKKYSDPVLSSSQTWIERTAVGRISKQLVLIHSYLPAILSIEEMVNSLLFENGPAILENLIIEMPENLMSIVNFLINNSTPGIRMKYRNAIVTRIIQIYPYFVRRIVEKFAKLRSDCIFGARLAIEYLGDRHFLEFLEPLLTDRESTLYKAIFRSAGRQVLSAIVERLLKMAEVVLNWQSASEAPEVFSTAPEMGEAPWCTRLAYCLVDLLNSTTEEWKEKDVLTLCRFVFRTTTSPDSGVIAAVNAPEPMDHQEDFQESMDSVVPDSDPESQATFRHKVPAKTIVEKSPFGDSHEIFVLAALIAVPVFTQYPVNQTGAVQPPDRAVDVWLDISRKRVLMGEKVTTSFGTHLIYIHSCIMSSRIDELAEFASQGMKRRVELDQQHNHTLVLKNTFTSRCMTEIEVAKRSVCQLITKCNDGDSLALRSIHALQTAGVYKTFQIDIGIWLVEQLEHISLPASELLADVVDGFAQSSVYSKGKGLRKEFVESAFEGDIFDGRTIAKRLFVLLYLCSYRETAHKMDSSLRNMFYDLKIYRKIPVRYLLSIMEQQHVNFESVKSKIITRTAVIFPFMLPTPDSMILLEKHQKTAEKEVIEEEEFGSERQKRIQAIRDQRDMIKMLETMDRSSIRDQLAAIPLLLDIYMESLSSTASLGYSALLISLYNRYEHLDPRTLFEKSAARWLLHDDEIDVEDVEKIPSLLFRCDRRILSSPPHFHCFIRCLNFFNKMVRAENRLKMLAAQQRVIQAQMAHRHGFEAERKEKELLNGAYLDNQHSVLIHALIEVCDSKRMKDDPGDFVMKERRRQIRRIACEYIHRQFLDYEGLIRIVLYQKFPLHQVRDLVEGVPALFAGTAQILEMLSLADQQRRFFAIVFASEICRKYRVRESLEAARAVCDVVHSLHKFGELPSSNRLWKHVAPALMLLAREFPSLSDSVNRLLMRVAANAKNRLAIRCGFLAGDPKHDEYELIETVSKFLDRNQIHDRL